MIQIENNGDSALSKVVFLHSGEKGHTVMLTGSFNDWDPQRQTMEYSENDRVYRTELLLAPGTYEYKLVIDGEWLRDESNPNFSANDFGTLNSVFTLE